MASALSEAVARALSEGRPAVSEGESAALLVGELPSGARLAIDAATAWSIVPEGSDAPVAFGEGTEGRFVEVLELGRRELEDLLEAGARASALPVDDVLAGFPAVPLLQAVLAMSSGYTARLALRFLLPSERAELLPLIVPLAKNGDMPQDVRDLAKHLSR